MSDQVERNWHNTRRRVNKKIQKPVKWNGLYFESIRKCGTYLGVNGSNLSTYIKEKRPIKGHIIYKVSKEEYEAKQLRSH